MLERLTGSLGVRVAAAVVVAELAILVLIGMFAVGRLNAALEQRTIDLVEKPGLLLTRGVMSLDAISDRETMRRLIGETLVDGMIVGGGGFVFYALDPAMVGRAVQDLPGFRLEWVGPDVLEPQLVRLSEGDKDYLIHITPLLVGGGQRPTFHAYIKVDTTELIRAKRLMTLAVVAASIIGIVLTSTMIIGMFRVTVLRRIQRVAERMQAIGAGASNLWPLAIGRDELGTVERSINVMAADLDRRNRQRDRLEAELRTSNERFRDFAAASYDWYWEVDSAFCVVLISQRFEEWVGTPVSAVIGFPFDRLGLVPESPGGWEALYIEMGRAEPFNDFDVRWTASDGRMRYARLSGVPTFGRDGVVRGYRGTGRETTAEREFQLFLERRIKERTRELERANEALRETVEKLSQAQIGLVTAERLASLGAMVAGVAHEINTPIGVGVTAMSYLSDQNAVIRGKFGDNALKKRELSDYLAMLEETSALVLSNLGRAASLIDSFKKVAADRTSENCRRFPIRPFLDDVVTSLSPAVRRAGVTLETDCGAVDALEIVSFPGLLSQVVVNLVMNALTHAFEPGGGGRLRLTCSADAGGGVILSLADNGKGIPAEVQGRVFDPFFTTRRSRGSTGLGLSIVHNIVTVHLGGRIALNSLPGQGTVFTIDLPARAPELPEGALEPDDGEAA